VKAFRRNVLCTRGNSNLGLLGSLIVHPPVLYRVLKKHKVSETGSVSVFKCEDGRGMACCAYAKS
jgi:hypothetical protein